MSISSAKKNSLVASATIVSGATAFSRVLGLLREQIMAWYFGASLTTDAFVTAFRVPNLLRDMFAEGALSSAFVPIFKEKLVRQTEHQAFALANLVLTALLAVVGLIVILGVIAAPAIIYASAHGFVSNAAKFALTVDLTRIMMVYLLMVSMSALVMGMLNSFGRFGVPALSPAMFNLGIIVSVLVLYKYFQEPAYTLAIGVVIGGAGQLAFQVPSLWRIGFRFKPKLDLLDEGLRRVMRLLAPMIVGLSAGRINIVLNTLLASFLMEGSISYLNYSYRLMHFPLGVFAVALGTVTLPRVSELVARGDTEGVKAAYQEALNLHMLVVLPSAAFLALYGRNIVDLIYQWGAFDPAAAANTALALLHYSYGLVGFAAVRVTVPIYYAFGDSRLPMRISIVSVFVNMALYYPLIKILDFAGLAAATSLAGLVNFGLLAAFLPRKGIVLGWARQTLNIGRMALAAGLAFWIAKLLPYAYPESWPSVAQRSLALVVPAAAAGLIYILLCLLLRVPETKRLLATLLRLRGSHT
ncbi:MAG: murein biosynthesis integral membrane protein MurJ [bacterium]